MHDTGLDVIETRHADIFGHPDAPVPERLVHTLGHQVVGRENSAHRFAATEDRFHRQVADVLGIFRFEFRESYRSSRFPHSFFVSAVSAGEPGQAPVAREPYVPVPQQLQVAGYLPGAVNIVGPDDVIRLGIPITQNIVAENGKRHLLPGQQLQQVRPVGPRKNETRHQVPLLQNGGNAQTLPARRPVITESQVQDAVFAGGAVSLRAAEDMGVIRMKNLAVAQQERDHLRAVARQIQP